MANAPQPTVQEVREELDRLLEDAAFRRAPSHSRLLRYLVERKTAGDDGALCEAGIAMAVFQRDPAAYDAEIDPIVRVSIGRLRDRLEKHYQRFERVPETIIMLPKGRYAPEFRHRPARAAAKAARGVAVMHTRNLTGDPALDALAHGLSNRLSEALVLMGLPRVIAQASVRQAQDATQSPAEIGRQLDAADVIETTISPDANRRLRISARLIRTGDAELAWAEARTAALDNPYAGIDALFDAVLARFATAPGAQKSANGGALPARPALPAAARSKIESARMLIAHLSVASIEQARALLTEVTSEYPDAADAWALRGRSCVRRLNFGDVAALPLVAELQECARTALALNAEHIEALALRALALHWSAALPEAEARFRDALRAAPNHTSARLGLAWLLLAQGRFNEALTELDAAGSFDPLSLNVLFNRASALMFARRHDDARAVIETGMRAGGESPFALNLSAANELFAGNPEAARGHYERLTRVAPDLAGGPCGLAYVAALRGDRDGARALRDAARAMAPALPNICDAELSSILRDRAAALAALRRAVAAMESMRLLLGVNPMFEWLADDPDFLAVLGSIGLQRWCGVRQPFPR